MAGERSCSDCRAAEEARVEGSSVGCEGKRPGKAEGLPAAEPAERNSHLGFRLPWRTGLEHAGIQNPVAQNFECSDVEI